MNSRDSRRNSQPRSLCTSGRSRSGTPSFTSRRISPPCVLSLRAAVPISEPCSRCQARARTGGCQRRGGQALGRPTVQQAWPCLCAGAPGLRPAALPQAQAAQAAHTAGQSAAAGVNGCCACLVSVPCRLPLLLVDLQKGLNVAEIGQPFTDEEPKFVNILAITVASEPELLKG